MTTQQSRQALQALSLAILQYCSQLTDAELDRIMARAIYSAINDELGDLVREETEESEEAA